MLALTPSYIFFYCPSSVSLSFLLLLIVQQQEIVFLHIFAHGSPTTTKPVKPISGWNWDPLSFRALPSDKSVCLRSHIQLIYLGKLNSCLKFYFLQSSFSFKLFFFGNVIFVQLYLLCCIYLYNSFVCTIQLVFFL